MQAKVLTFLILSGVALGDYWSDRDKLIAIEESQMLGSDVVLTEEEEAVNEFLMKDKLREYDSGFTNPRLFSPSRHFFEVRDNIEESNVFKFIKQMPKGGALHGHDTSLLSYNALYNLTYEDNLYACTVNKRLKLKFMNASVEDEECKWKLLSDLRKEDPYYDVWLQSQLTLVTENPREAYQDINEVWRALDDVFETVTPLVTYRPVMETYVYQALLELYEDNVFYLEFRSTLPEVYELNGYVYNPIEVAGIYKKVADKFKQDYPDFIDVRLIYAPVRNVNNATVEEYVNIVNELEIRYPGFLVGFDLVGQEDIGKPLSEFIQLIQTVSQNISFIFHAGETNWFGSSTDLNLVDAILLGTKRIGHGYGLIKHPLLMALAKNKGIAVEVCPISNQVLMLVEDLRNHPAAHLIASGYPIVVSYDDPSFWGSKGLSYDFYLAFMGMASRSSDLRLLKKLAENSFTYSALSVVEKRVAKRKWHKTWNTFIGTTYRSISRL
ncbi:hypothetical protein RN001_015112 [Aquatica leii]|uniref:Adenosine deaminase n=1 Tax=Aquatica leii TaxID=1421715 RepID=A0AAN7P1D4_9COLE|nr:hypothetical protein RN001_015112 [Aquatica leii]